MILATWSCVTKDRLLRWVRRRSRFSMGEGTTSLAGTEIIMLMFMHGDAFNIILVTFVDLFSTSVNILSLKVELV
jgi:hypothetical protein